MTWRRMCHFHCTELQERLSQGYTAKEQLPVKHEKEKISWDKAIQDSFIYVHYISFWMHLYINTTVFTTLPFKRVFNEYLLLLSLIKEFVTLILTVSIKYYLREIIIIFQWYWLCHPACTPAKALPKWGGGGGFERLPRSVLQRWPSIQLSLTHSTFKMHLSSQSYCHDEVQIAQIFTRTITMAFELLSLFLL